MTYDLNKQKCVVSQFWSPKVQEQGVAGLALPGAVREGCVPGLFPWLVHSLLSSSLHIICPLCVSVSKFPSLKRTPAILD